MTTRIRRALSAVLAASCLLGLMAAPVQAADGEEDRPLELWLDRPLPEDVAPGIEIPIGMMVWDRLGGALIADNPPFVRILPATGDAEPSIVSLVEDWNGHYTGTIQVPEGGMGTFEAGFGGTACDETSCRRQETLLPIEGVGPPPDAPLPAIAQAEILVGDAPTAGEPTQISILLQPNVGWGGATFATPDHVILQVREPRADVIDQVVAEAGNRLLRYEAEITLPEAKDYLLQAAEDRGGTAGQVFGASLIPVTAEAGATEPVPADASGGVSTDVLIVVGFAGVVALAALTLFLAMRRA